LYFRELLKSSFFFFKLTFKKTEIDTVFIYLSHFNRHKGTNPYLSQLIKNLKKDGKKFLVFEDADLGGSYKEIPRSRSAIPFDFITLIYIVLLKLGISQEKIFRLIKKIIFRNLSFKTVINMAGYTNTFFLSEYPDSKFFEVQHGMIFNGREWWMRDAWNKYPNCGLILFGDGFKKMINDNPSIYLPKKDMIRLINYENKNRINPSIKSNIILLSEQITVDNSDIEIKEYLGKIDDIFVSSEILEKNGLQLLTKTHPRTPPRELYKRNIQYQNRVKSLNGVSEIFCHVTFNSSTIFEMGLCGIPTILVAGLERRNPSFFITHYEYPFKELLISNKSEFNSAINFLKNKSNYELASKDIMKWSKSFYSKRKKHN